MTSAPCAVSATANEGGGICAMNVNHKAVLEPAYVLHHRPYRDSSLILDVLTAGHGRIALVARGARRPKSRLHGLLQPFQPLLMSWSLRRELGTLAGVEARDGGGLRGRTLISGFYVNELLVRLLHRHDPHPRLFAAYEAVIRALAGTEEESAATSSPTPAAEQSALRLFEKDLLREIGYGLVLDHDVADGAPLRADAVYYYYLERGPVSEGAAVHPETPDAAEEEHVARDRPVRLRGGSLLALARGELHDPQSLREAKRLMRAALGARLGNKPLLSRALFRRPAGRGPDAGCEEAVNAMADAGSCT